MALAVVGGSFPFAGWGWGGVLGFLGNFPLAHRIVLADLKGDVANCAVGGKNKPNNAMSKSPRQLTDRTYL